MAAKPLPPVEYLRECLDYNPETGVLTWKEGRRAGGKQAGWKHKDATKVELDGITYRAHRMIWMLMTASDPGALEVDHRNRDPWDNRWENLRLATSAQNKWNTMGYSRRGLPKGVRRHRSKYQARVFVGSTNRHSISLGVYVTVEAASAAYLAFVSQAHGEFFFDPAT